MKDNFVLSSMIALFAFAAAAALPACSSSSSSDSATGDTGASLYKSQCATCHGSVGQGDLGPNITGSTTAGIGSWTAAQFATAVRTGVDDEGEMLCASMTRFTTTALSDAQLTQIHDYLLTQIDDTDHEGTACP